jgi:two-component system, OmpR family, phosphate regulon sensor histidine kinase PhoR
VDTGGHDFSAHAQIALAREAALSRLLLDAARTLGETLVPVLVYDRFREILRDAIRYDGLIVSAYDPALGTIRCEYAWADGQALDATTFPELRLNPSGGMQSEVIRTGHSLLTNDVPGRVQGPGTYYDVDASGEIRRLPESGPPDAQAAMMVPIKHEGVVVGVVQAMTDSGTYTNDELELFEGLVAQMGAAVRNARLHEERARLEAREAAANAVAAEREQAAQVLEAVGDGIALIDQHGIVRFWNHAAEILTGVDAHDGPADGVFTDWRSVAEHIPVTPSLSAPRAVTLPVDVHGRELWLSFVAVQANEGVVYAFRDVTRERELENAKSDFIATVSHELRTPMAAVFGAAQTLLRQDVNLSELQRRELLEMIASQATRLAHVTEDVLLANSLDRGELRVTAAPLDIDEIVRETVQTQVPGAELHLQGGAVLADRDRVQQVLVNLLDNAVKYGGGRISVTSERRETSVRVSITDDGIGIAPADEARVFEKFFRADPHHMRSPTGSGLGLYICKELVERMGGRIGVESGTGSGSTFWFDLPLR